MTKYSRVAEIEAELRHYVRRDHKRPYSLANIRRFMEFLGNPQERYTTVHIAGTSGKSSTAYFTSALLHHAGYSVGLSVSPHIDSVKERAQINGTVLSDAAYCRAFSRFLPLVKRSGISLTYFEVLVSFAYWLFAEKNVTYAVMEVGLGGLLDGTNVIQRPDKVCIITDIGLDHTEVLGSTLPEIARQKAGIIQPLNNVHVQPQTKTVMSVLSSVCSQKGAKLHIVDQPPSQLFKELGLPLFQRRNLQLAVQGTNQALEELHKAPLLPRVIAQAAAVHIPGRMEVLQKNGKQLVIDGSHNPQKIVALVAALREAYPTSKFAILCSIGANKRSYARSMLARLLPIATTIVLTRFSSIQDEMRVALEPEELAVMCRQLGYPCVCVEPNPKVALEQLLAGSEESILITGSYFLLNDVGLLWLRS